ncbi:MAG: hypothetical protein K940chlam1_00787 [Candidatus Anoxychlamydiales bacterium]|nr:hypothetical protein [Candidatus Anoxychlamydiales bacterium]NGX35360.1 hypothetical protein [Candidatus Anoxychlamydiales bacterium]
MSVVPYGSSENPRVLINPPEPLRATGPELGWKLSDMARQVLQIPNQPTSTLAKLGYAIGQRTIDVSINTLAPLCLVSTSEGFGYLAIRSRSILGFGLNASGVISHTFQALDPRVPQFGAHAAEAVKYLYRGGIDASIFGINFVHPEAGIYLMAAEGAALLLAPNLIRSAANTVFRSVDALVDASVSRLSRLFNAQHPSFRLAISNAQISRLTTAEGPVSLELKQIGNRFVVTDIRDSAIEDAEERSVSECLEGALVVAEEPGGASSGSGRGRSLTLDDLVDDSADRTPVARRRTIGGTKRKRRTLASEESTRPSSSSSSNPSSPSSDGLPTQVTKRGRSTRK